MRLLLAVACVLGGPVAHAETFKPTVVWQNRVVDGPGVPGVSALTNVSHKLYLNDCQPSGCTVSPGSDNSLTNRSSIPVSTVVLDAYPHGGAHWNLLVQCARDTFAPFDVEIVTTDPGPSVPHFEVMIGGTSQQLHPQLEAGGVAPFISCGASRNNVISFVFAETTSDLEFLCGAIAQEACHVWGLDHELNAKDPMTYLDLGSSKRFQNDDAQCGESSPRGCWCGGDTQNSFRYMTTTFGLDPSIGPASIAITTPKDGAWVRAGFPIGGVLTSPLEMLETSLAIDGTHAQTVDGGPIAFNAPPTLSGGAHAITVSATDAGDRTASATVNVNVLAPCASGKCPSGFACLGNTCLPDANVAGGLGAACLENADCVTGTCGNDGTDKLCTAQCDPGNVCPAGFDCLSNICWPAASDGGCTTTGGSPAWMLIGLAVLALAIRRRR